MKSFLFAVFALFLVPNLILPQLIKKDAIKGPQIEYNPKHYVCYRTNNDLIIDGKISEEDWKKAEWTDYFVDIEGDLKPEPTYKTRVKMLWDDEYFYFAAKLEEPDIWAKLKQRDAVIYYDNDFEIFLDPDGDTHNYYEYEVNAFGTEWDLFIRKPYRDESNVAINAWDIKGLQTGIDIKGTINNPSDKDSSWSVEVAIPFEVLKEVAFNLDDIPKNGDQWKVNFSRVQWDMKVENGDYIKKTDKNGKTLPEHNWVWSPQGIIAMHYPEMWGIVQFSENLVGSTKVEFIEKKDENAKWFLRQIYYKQSKYFSENNKYTSDMEKLGLSNINVDGYKNPNIEYTKQLFEASIMAENGSHWYFIKHDGKVWRVE